MIEERTIDELGAFLLWVASDSPARAWQRASFAMATDPAKPRGWMARLLRIDVQDERTWFALAGFAPMEIEGVWHIAATVPATNPFDPDEFPCGDVVAVNPATNTAQIVGEAGPALVLPRPQPESIFIHLDPMRWLREWADARVIWLEQRRQAISGARIVPTFNGEPPSGLAIGDINAIRWGGLYARHIRADFSHHKAIKRAIFRAADLPRVEAA
jgi:hypothetical protein